MINISKKLFNIRLWKSLYGSFKYNLNRKYHELFIFNIYSSEKIFNNIWKNNYWGSEESLSGPGSTLDYTKELRKKLPIIIEKYKIKKILDAPCGDLHWMQHINFNEDVEYIGGDIVNDIIEINKNKNINLLKYSFHRMDITSDLFPKCDLWLCRAVFYHLSNHDIYRALKQFIDSNIKYILTTNHLTDDTHVNIDILTGDWRILNLKMYPFDFPNESIEEFDDYIYPHPPASLVLWSREQIVPILPKLRKNLIIK